MLVCVDSGNIAKYRKIPQEQEILEASVRNTGRGGQSGIRAAFNQRKDGRRKTDWSGIVTYREGGATHVCRYGIPESERNPDRSRRR